MTGPRPAGTMHTHGPDLNPADDDRPGGLPEDGRRRAHHAAAPDHADPQQDERDGPADGNSEYLHTAFSAWPFGRFYALLIGLLVATTVLPSPNYLPSRFYALLIGLLVATRKITRRAAKEDVSMPS